MRRVQLVSGGIAPSPHAKVGKSVIDAIASYAGKPVSIHRNGRADTAYPFTETIKRRISPPGRRPLQNLTFSLIAVPDLRLLAREFPDVANVWFGAAPTPAVLHWLLRVLAHAVKRGLISSASRCSILMHRFINRCNWGPDRGGMFVEVWGQDKNGNDQIRSWHLTAEGDSGPMIPTLACESIIRRYVSGRAPAAGARPASGELEWSDFEPSLRKIAAQYGERTEPAPHTGPLFRRVLRDAWERLPLRIRELHEVSGPRTFHGLASVTRGRSALSRAIAWIMGFPDSGTQVSVDVDMDEHDGTETWTRNFGGHRFASNLSYHRNDADWLLWERFGPVRIGMALAIEHDQLWYVPQEWSFFRMPLPRFLLPNGRMVESVVDDRFNFHVEVCLPLAGHVVTYQGWLQDESAS